MNFVSKNFNKARSLVTKLEFVTKDLKAEFQYPALFEPFWSCLMGQNSLSHKRFTTQNTLSHLGQKKNQMLSSLSRRRWAPKTKPLSLLSSHRHRLSSAVASEAQTIADEAPLRANRCQLSSTATLQLAVATNHLAFATI